MIIEAYELTKDELINLLATLVDNCSYKLNIEVERLDLSDADFNTCTKFTDGAFDMRIEEIPFEEEENQEN
jgi:hypothetical protein